MHFTATVGKKDEVTSDRKEIKQACSLIHSPGMKALVT